MEKVQPLISICIPTYNRYEYLKKSIESIIPQPNFQRGNVEVVVSDNASTDKTQDMMLSLAARYKNIKYHRNAKNIVVYNYPLVISLATGKLRKLSGDTFIYNENSLDYLCRVVEQYEPERPQLFFLNKFRNEQETEIICNSFDEFVQRTSYWTTWLGSFSIWDHECEKIKDDTDGCEMLLWQERKMYELVAKKRGAIICNKRTTFSQSVERKDVSYGIYKVFYLFNLSIIKTYVDARNLTCKTYEYIRKDLLYNFFTDILIVWESNRNRMIFSNQENLKQLIFHEYENEQYWENYEKYYKKRRVVVTAKELIKSILKKLHIWDFMVTFHIKDQ